MKYDFETPDGRAALLSRIGAGILALVLVVAFFSSYSVIEPGYTGVIFNIWTGSLRTVPQGLTARVPWVTRVQSYPTALRTYTMVARSNEGSATGDDSLDLPTREGQHIRQDLSVTYNTSEDRAADVFRSFRGEDIQDIEATFIRRTIITVAQNAAGQMSLTEVISSKRDELQNTIQANLSKELTKMGFTLDKVNMGASHLPPALEQQMQQKMAAQQQAQQAEYELQKQQMLAKAAVAKAEGEAQSAIVRAKGESEANRLLQSSITPAIIQNRTIDKWDGVLPVVTGGGSIPMLDLKNLRASKGGE
jgi:regulator of protease activity HflC (stomatin/prohibitin superfamily)